MSRAKYLELNERLAEVMFSLDQAGRPVYVGAEDSALARSVDGLETEGQGALDYLRHLTRATLFLDEQGTSPFRWHLERTRLIKDPTETPPSIGLLTLLAVAADQMAQADGMSQSNYYGRLANLLEVPDERRARMATAYQSASEELWGSLNQWLIAWEGSRGVPTAYTVGHRYVGLPMSQSLVRAHDREQLVRVFAAEGLPAGLQMAPRDMEELLAAWVSRSPSPFTSSFRTLFANGAARERMLEVICLELEAWDGERAEGVVLESRAGALGELRLTANVHRLFGQSLEMNLMVPLSESDDRALTIGEDANATTFELTRPVGGVGYIAGIGGVDFGSMVGRLIAGHLNGSTRQMQRKPRRVVPLRWSDLHSRFVEIDRVERGDPGIVILRTEALPAVSEYLSAAARPGYEVFETMQGLPEGWALVTKVEIVAVVKGSAHRDVQVLIPLPASRLSFVGGLSLPGNLRKWSSLAPPEVHAMVAEAPRVTVRVDRGSRVGDEIARQESAGDSLIMDPLALGLDDGEYLFTLWTDSQSKPIASASLRLRSADTPVSEEAVDGLRLVYDQGADVRWAVSAGERTTGDFVDGVDVRATPSKDLDAVGRARDFFTRPKPVRSKASRQRVTIGETVAVDSCMITGAHRWNIEMTRARFARGECVGCGAVQRFVNRKKSRRDNEKPSEAETFSTISVRPVKEPPQRGGIELFDAICHVGTGSYSDISRVVSFVDANPIVADAFVRDMESLGHIDVRRDDMNAVREWGVNFPSLVPTESGWYLSGRSSPTLIESLRRVVGSAGGEVDIAESAFVRDVRVALDNGMSDRVRGEIEDLGVMVHSDNPARALAESLPPITSLALDMKRVPFPATQKLERWDTASATWTEASSAMEVGAYRLTNFSRVYCVRTADDIAQGMIRVADARLAKHIAGAWAKDPLVGYHERSASLLVPKGADLPGLYSRAATVASGHRPLLTASGLLQYRDVGRELADLIFHKLSF